MFSKTSGLIAFHAVFLLCLTLIATFFSPDAAMEFFWCTSVGLALAQLVLVGVFASCVLAPMVFRLRWAYRLILLQWLCFSVPLLAVVVERPMPWCLLATQLIVFVAAYVVGWIARLVLRRRVQLEDNLRIAVKNNFQIIDLLILCTACAVVLGISAKYSEEVGSEFLAGIEYAIMIIVGVCIGMPFAAFLAIYIIGLANPSGRFVKYWCSMWLAIALVICAWCISLWINADDRHTSDAAQPFAFMITLIAAVAGTTFSAIYFRINGFRMMRIAKETKSLPVSI